MIAARALSAHLKPPTINVPHFRFMLVAALQGYGKAPASVEIERIAGPVPMIRASWSPDVGRPVEALTVKETTVIEQGGPSWVAQLIMSTRARRREMLKGSQ